MKKFLVYIVAGMLFTGCGQTKEETQPAEQTMDTQPITEETEQETEAPVPEEPLETEAGEVILDSYYQKVNASWQDTYLALLYAVQIQQEEGTSGPPYFALLKFPEEEVPVMICGNMSDVNSGYGHYRIYGYEDNMLYELFEMDGVVTMDLANNKLALETDGACYHYLYREQNLVRTESGSHLEHIPMTQLYEHVITIDNLENYLQTSEVLQGKGE